MDPLSGKVKGFLVGGTQFHDVTRDLSRLHHSSRDPHKNKAELRGLYIMGSLSRLNGGTGY